jgi:hypothetical protein
VKTQPDNNQESSSDKITFVSYRDDEEPRAPPAAPLDRNRLELFRRAYDPNAAERPPEREKRIKFEVVDDNPQKLKKRTGFNPYDTGVVPKILPPRR